MPEAKLRIRPESLLNRRLQAVLSREELAEKAGLSSATIKAIESGISQGVWPRTVRKLVVALDCDPAALSEVIQEQSA